MTNGTAILEIRMKNSNLSVALVHHPILKRDGSVSTTSVTTLDVHDMGRLCRTYGFLSVYIVTPLKEQSELVKRMIDYWVTGPGKKFNPHRKEALSIVKVVDSLDDIKENIRSCSDCDGAVRFIATGAGKSDRATGYEEAKAIIDRADKNDQFVLLFGTGGGLAPSAVEMAQIRLAPIEGAGDYNHLPVRCAAAITIDRLVGRIDKRL